MNRLAGWMDRWRLSLFGGLSEPTRVSLRSFLGLPALFAITAASCRWQRLFVPSAPCATSWCLARSGAFVTKCGILVIGVPTERHFLS